MGTADTIPAFPGAQGYGKHTSGGRGGEVYVVTNLNDSGEGSLREAVEADGPRTVVFRVSGTIELESDLRIRNPHITIAGQTAPGGGITLKGYLGINADEVVVRYIRVRCDGRFGDGDALNGRYNENVVLDHVSTSWGADEVLSIYHNSHVTIQHCVVAEAVGDGGGHKFGAIWGDDYSTYHHNLFAHNASRNPRFASGCGHVDFRNNVLYNWGYNSVYGGEKQQPGNDEFDFTTVNMVANYYKPGPATSDDVRGRIVGPSTRDGVDDLGKWYVSENVVEGSPEVTADNWTGVAASEPDVVENLRLGSAFHLDEPWSAMDIRQESAVAAYETVLDGVGASLHRDPVDTRVVNEVRTGTATYGDDGIISSPSDVGGWPALERVTDPVYTDTSGNGIPDWWLEQYGLDVHDPDVAHRDLNDTGYTTLEEYVNGTDPTEYVDYTQPENNVDTLTADDFRPPGETATESTG